MRGTLLRVGGVLNGLFVLFHIWLGWRLHVMRGIDPGIRPLLETFNGVGALELVFFAFVSLAYPAELLATRIGRAVVGLVLASYLGRTLCELFVYPKPKPLVIATCLLVCAVYAAAWLVRESRRVPATQVA